MFLLYGIYNPDRVIVVKDNSKLGERCLIRRDALV